MSSSRIGNVGTVVLVICAVAVTVSVIRRDLVMANSRAAAPARLATKVVADWRKYAETGHSLGSPEASATIVEFADFQCPACRLLWRVIDSLQSSGESIRLVYRHYPLSIHRAALPAVHASECAAEQGSFVAMHGALFLHADSLGVAPWSWYAREANVRDPAQFARCMRSSAPIRALDADTADANRLGIRGTPMLLVGDLLVQGVPPLDSLKAYIRRAQSAANR